MLKLKSILISNKVQIFIILIFTFLLLFAAPVNFNPVYDFDIVITATGEKNSQAKSSEVWLNAPSYKEINNFIKDAKLPEGWENRDGSLVSYQNQPTSLTFTVSSESKTSLYFTAHQYSGKALVKINNKFINVDLFSEIASQKIINLESYIAYDKINKYKWFSKIFTAFFAYLSIFTCTFVCIYYRSRQKNHLSYYEFTWLDTFKLALPSLTIYLLAHIVFWPGQMSPDSIDQWHQILSGNYNDNHPVFSTLMFKVATIFYINPAAPIFMQYTLLSLVTGLLLSEFRKWGLSKVVVLALAIIIPLFPANFLIATTLWKDVLYAVNVLYLTFAGLVIIRKNWAISRSFLSSVFIASLLLVMIRHNGVIVAPLILLTFGLAKIRSSVGKILILQGISLLLIFFLLKAFVMSSLNVTPIGEHYKAMHAVNVINGMLNNGARFSDTEKKLLDGYMPISEWKKNYQCQTVVPIFWAGGNSGFKYLAKNKRNLNNLAIRLIIENPQMFIKNQVCLNSIIWRIYPYDTDFISISPGEITLIEKIDKLELTNKSLAPKMRVTLNEFVDKYIVNSFFFGRPAFWLYAITFTAIIFTIHHGWRFLILISPAILTTISNALMDLSPDYRYHYPMVLTSLFLIPFFLLSKVFKKQRDK
jgi:hypothetical protein